MVFLSKSKSWLFIVVFGYTLFLGGCISESEPIQQEIPVKEKKKFEMYELSEMSAMMRQLYQLNEQLKERIIAGESLGDFPKSIERMLSAKMTDDKKMDDFFEEHAKTFIELQEKIYNDSAQAKVHFNAAIDACIQCHRVKCAGPIPKIEKLLIKV